MCRHSESSRDAAWSSVILAQITQLSAICSDNDSDNVCVSLIEVSISGSASAGPPSSRQKNNFPVTVKIRTSGYQTLECFIATLPT